MPDHPDHEQLAAFQAGDGDRRQRTDVETHLAACPSCTEVVASVAEARSRLTLLDEPPLPPGLHGRLTAAIEAEAAQPATDHATSRPRGWVAPAARQSRRAPSDARESGPAVPGDGRTRRVGPGAGPGARGARAGAARDARPAPWYRRPVAWGAAAALLLAALVVPFLDQSGGDLTTAGRGDAGGGATQEGAAAGTGQLPLIRIQGEVSAATVRSRLAADTRARSALDSATARGGQAAAPPEDQNAPAAPQATGQGDAFRSSASAPPAATADLPSCLPAAAAAANPATRPLVPAFYIEGTYQGRPATILVTTSTAQPGRVDYWVFPRNNCSAPPLATKRVR